MKLIVVEPVAPTTASTTPRLVTTIDMNQLKDQDRDRYHPPPSLGDVRARWLAEHVRKDLLRAVATRETLQGEASTTKSNFVSERGVARNGDDHVQDPSRPYRRPDDSVDTCVRQILELVAHGEDVLVACISEDEDGEDFESVSIGDEVGGFPLVVTINLVVQ
eukprot:CAMPEP_0167772890 /NCGR_PEP_ID=MMETSP0111_2-20121227/1106_1 /TAXON_ID=91324 /ORGANISM="Lotharella globosa, Strain CCCM811" /LENGTH=162 /DNA_ID=CAMNT_0007662447 /DNA_START=68 /DNA_END=556 /DNA_ORIENTATION=+